MSKGNAISPTHLAVKNVPLCAKNQICGLRLLGYDFHLVSQDSTNLDLLRSFAVLLVLFDHTIKFLGFEHYGSFDINWMGRIGVTFFFVHTSLVLMLSLERLNLQGWRLALNFYIRRLFRLFPLSWFFILLTWISGIPQASVHPHVLQGLTIGPKVLLSNLTLTQNVLGAPDILGQLWSLPVEWNMYLLLPLLFLLTRKFPRGFVFAAWPIAGVVGLLHVYSLRSLPGMWRLNVLTFLPCFVPGVMAYVLCRQKQPFLNSLLWPLSLITLVFVFLLRPSWPFAWIVALAVGLSVVLFKEQPRPYVNAVTRSIAKYSYGIYLGHTLCIWAAFSVLHRSPWYAQVLGYAILLVTIPVLCFRVIEKPCIDLGKRIADSLRPMRPESNLGRERVLAKSA